MKKYDFERVKTLIETTPDVVEAVLGMDEDWFWTAEVVYVDGGYAIELNEETTIGGISGSSWATPMLKLYFSDGKEQHIEVSVG